MGQQQPDYDALARRFNGSVAPDYDALAAHASAPAPQPQGSATSRFLSNAWDVLNPLQVIEGLNALLHDPLGTTKNIALAQVEQGRQALENAAAGRASEASGHATAAMLPVIGPMAAQAGEQIASGDIAGGLGRTAGFVAPVAAEGAIRGAVKARALVPGSIREGVAGALERGAAARYEDVMAPKVGQNKVRFGNQAAKVAPELSKNPDMAAMSREGLHNNVRAGLEQAKQSLDDATDARLVSQQVKTGPLLAALDREIAGLTATPAEAERVVPTYQGQGGRPTPSGLTRNIESGRMQPALDKEGRPLGKPIEPAPSASQIATLRQIRSEIAALGPVAPYESVRRIRQAWDQVAKAKYMSATTADAMKSQGEATGAMKGTGAMREALASTDPKTAEANAQYSLYKASNDVLDATREVERTRPKVGRQIMARVAGSIVGGETAGATGAVVGYAGGPLLDSALQAGFTTKLKTAKLMTQLARVIRTGDAVAVDNLVAKIRGLLMQKKRLAGRAATNPNESQQDTAPTSGRLPLPSGS